MILEEHKMPNLIQALRFSAGTLQQEHSWKQTKLFFLILCSKVTTNMSKQTFFSDCVEISYKSERKQSWDETWTGRKNPSGAWNTWKNLTKKVLWKQIWSFFWKIDIMRMVKNLLDYKGADWTLVFFRGDQVGGELQHGVNHVRRFIHGVIDQFHGVWADLTEASCGHSTQSGQASFTFPLSYRKIGKNLGWTGVRRGSLVRDLNQLGTVELPHSSSTTAAPSWTLK